jgi:hypothetical protein
MGNVLGLVKMMLKRYTSWVAVDFMEFSITGTLNKEEEQESIKIKQTE